MKDFIATKQLLIKTTAPTVRRQLLTLRDRLLDLRARYRQSRQRPGALPHFLIIGAQKAGTTFLYDELVKHPQILGAMTKEVHFFDSNYHKGTAWYRSFFPTPATLAARQAITGEASPSYLVHPHAARRVQALTPNVKLIVLLRDPVARAYSHYHHEVRLGYETLPFAAAIARERERLAGEYERMVVDEAYTSPACLHFSYRMRGEYVTQLHQWYAHFPHEQILTLSAEELYRHPAVMLRAVLTFLGLPPSVQPVGRQHKAFPYAKIDSDLRRQLQAYFAPYNARLYDYINQDYGWT
jgi:hypothetical protein